MWDEQAVGHLHTIVILHCTFHLLAVVWCERQVRERLYRRPARVASDHGATRRVVTRALDLLVPTKIQFTTCTIIDGDVSTMVLIKRYCYTHALSALFAPSSSSLLLFVLHLLCLLTLSTTLSSPRNFAMTSSASTQAVKLRFITNEQCPFAHKAWLALECSGLQYTTQQVSLYGSNGKPDWFWQLNPEGTVPVLIVEADKQIVLPDSNLILDWMQDNNMQSTSLSIDQCSADKSDTADKIAQWRRMVDKMLPVGKNYVLSKSNKQGLITMLQEMDASVVGPYLTGDTVTTADCHAFPFLWRLSQRESKVLDGCASIKNWLAHCQRLEAFKKTTRVSSWWWWW
jgi:glutathione S-transferase